MQSVTVRRAASGDLPAIGAIYHDEETRDAPDAPPFRPLAYHAHLLAAGELHVAERDGAVIGSSGRILRGGVSFLTDLFVRPEAQSGHTGAALLRAALPDDGSARCTYASSDPRALSLYTRADMLPRYPQCSLRAATDRMHPLPDTGLGLVETDPDDPDLARWDEEISGRRRPQELAYWYSTCRALPCWLERDARRAGYALIQRHSDGSIWYPEAWTIGPLGVRAPEDAALAMLAAAEWARSRCAMLRLFLPGPHPALAPLLDAGLRIADADTYCASSAALLDPMRYVSSFDLL